MIARLSSARFASVAPILLAFLLLTCATPTMAIEEPAYRVVRTIDDVEVRDYPAFTVAEIAVAGSAGQAGSEGFPVLFAYISGRNAGDRHLAMTAPVIQTATPVSSVTASADGTGYLVRFVLPAGATRDTAPEPLDPRIHLRDIRAQRVAVIRYSGFWSDANYASHLERLKAVVAESGLQAVDQPLFSRYDPPFKPWFMRRNEIWLPLASP